MVRVTCHASVALAGLTCGDRDLRPHYLALGPIRGTLIIYLGMAGDRLLGRLARAMDEPDLAAHHFEDALRLCRASDCRPELAWSCYDYADLLLATGGAEQRAHDLLREALALSRALEMQPLTNQAQLVASVDKRGAL